MIIQTVVNMFFATNADLFSTVSRIDAPVVKPWKPVALDHASWPPNYRGVYAWRMQQLAALRADPELRAHAWEYYSTRPAEFIMHWMDTYNPRKKRNKWMPFVFFMRQDEFITYLEELRADSENGLVEKCRDIGATWLVCAYSVWCWLFLDDFAFGWGSRKQELVDKLGDPDSIFEKMRLLIKRLPDIWLPPDFKTREHATFMKLINPNNGSTITGESGDNIGRGGRKTMYGKDESAHYERPEKIESALGDNTDIQIDISSVNGLGNPFHRRRESGVDWAPGRVIDPGFTRVFVFDWRDHPEKTQEWYDRRKARAEREGLQHVFAQEVDRNYSAAVQNTVINYEWITAAVDAHLKVPYLQIIQPPETYSAGLDVADGESNGNDRNALAIAQWIILRHVDEWGARDQAITARKAIDGVRTVCKGRSVAVQYDCIGVGAGVKTEYNRLIDDGIIERTNIDFVPWNAGDSVINPFDHIIPDDDQSLINKDFFHNFKAQAWWSIRTRFYKTWRAVTFGDVYHPDELISLDGSMPLLMQVMKELAQPTSGRSTTLKMLIEKKPDGTRSPNLADSIIQAFFPVPENNGYTLVGSYSG